MLFGKEQTRGAFLNLTEIQVLRILLSFAHQLFEKKREQENLKTFKLKKNQTIIMNRSKGKRSMSSSASEDDEIQVE